MTRQLHVQISWRVFYVRMALMYLCLMFQIGDVIVSEEILEKQFVCDLSRCKGACCVEGDAGAPVTSEEAKIMEDIFEDVKPFLRPEGVAAIQKHGTTVTDPSDGELVTPLVNGAECAYVIFDEKGITKCGIEKAWESGAVDFRKPISCHLYPVRIAQYSDFEAVNYHKWEICSPACDLGASLQVPVYKFLKDSLITKYGSEWYLELEEVAKAWKEQKRS